tara:strand:+ start:8933 stop:9790 length:858 start_codon:yes stop_codon:yes gene_type:complete
LNILAILFTLSNIAVANIDINVKVSKEIIFVGDKVKVSILARNTEKLKVQFPEFNVDNEDISLSTLSIDDTTLVLSLQFWQSGNHQFPSIKIQISSEEGSSNFFSTNPIDFNILDRYDSLDNGLRKSKDNKDLYIPIGINQLVLILIIFLSLLAIYRSLKTREKENSSQPFTQKIDFYNDARNELANLALPGNMDSKELEAFYISLGNILKKYLLEKFFFNATNMTTNEIIIYLKSHNIPIDGLTDLLQEADLCKFAKKKYGVTKLIEGKNTAQCLLDRFESIVI